MSKREFYPLVLVLILLVPALTSAWPIPDTGQTKCYDNSTEIPCPQEGETFYGQDASYTINPPSYTKLDTNGNDLTDDATDWVMIRDNVTGLIWEVKQNMDDTLDYANPHDADNYYTWYDSNPETNGGDAGTQGEGTDTEDFINALNSANYGGHSDWRMPTVKELQSIVDYGRYDPAINTAYFPDTMSYRYWSSTTSADSTNMAWGVYSNGGSDIYGWKSDSCHVRAVRGEQSGLLDNLVNNGDGTVTDTNTGLMWQQAIAPGHYKWEQALSYCENLYLAGYSDWRLPTIKELESIVDMTRYLPAIKTEFFPGNVATYYWWSSITNAQANFYAKIIDFTCGSMVDGAGKVENGYVRYVRAVRSGQNLLIGHLDILTPRQADRWLIDDLLDITWDTQSIEGDVKISLSRQGGKEDSFKTIAESTENDGIYSWMATGPLSPNCTIKIEPISEPGKSNSAGLFSIDEIAHYYIEAAQASLLQQYRLSFMKKYRVSGTQQIDTQWALSDNTMATINGDLLTASKTGCVEVSTTYRGKEYTKTVYLKTLFDQFEMEQNNTADTANPLTQCRFMEGELLIDDTDYYKMYLPSDATTELAYFSRSTTADVKVEIYDGSNTLLASTISNNGKSLLFPLGLKAGNYYVKLTSSGDIDQNETYDVVYKAVESLPATQVIDIPVGGSAQGRINHLQDKASFTFNTNWFEKRQGFYIEFLPDTRTADYHIAVLDANQQIIREADSATGLMAIIDAIPGDGTYTIEVTAGQVIDAESAFTLRVGEADYFMEVEPNDTYPESSPFEVNETIKGFLDKASDDDFYALQVTAPVYLELSFEFPKSAQNISIDVYKDSDQNLINGIVVPAGQVVTFPMGLSIGRYYFKISGDSPNADKKHPYTFIMQPSDQTDLEIESNNTLRFANAIEKAISRKGRIFSVSDIDYYGFHLPETAFFSVTFDPDTLSGDYKISLVDDNDQSFTMKTSADGATCTINSNKTPGNYYIKIENNGNVDQHSAYNITLTSAAAITGLKQLVSVTVSGSSPEMPVGTSQTLTATASYSDATTEIISAPIWSSLNEDVASVNAAGLVNANAEGTTSIVAGFGGFVGKLDITVGAPVQTVSQHYGNLILVAGGGVDATNTLKESTQYLSDLVYSRFQHRLFANEDIYYFNPITWHDLDGDGYDNNVVDDSSPTANEFGLAVTHWAAQQSTDGPLYIYLIDHGGIDTFKIFPNEIITAAQLKGHIDTFRNATGRRVIVMIEACKSGSFTDDLTTADDDVIAVTSTDTQDSYIQLGGKISFTQFFVDRLLTGDSLYNAWFKAKDSLKNMGIPYSLMKPQLAEGIFTASRNTMLGGDFAIASLFPEISGQSPNAFIQADTTHNLYVDLSDLEDIDSVWAVVLTPDYVPPSTSQDLEAPVVALPVVDLTDLDRNGRYEGSFNTFIYNGQYRFTFYARNVNGNVTASPVTIITVSGGQNLDQCPDDPNKEAPGVCGCGVADIDSDNNGAPDCGDINSDASLNLADVVLVLQVLSGITPAEPIYTYADVNGDGEIGLAEVNYILQKIAGMR